VDLEAMKQDGRRIDARTREAKMVAIELSCRHSGEAQRAIGSYYGIGCGAMGRIRELFRKDAERDVSSVRLANVAQIERRLGRYTP
jgi:coproporphyrinogen III oxidase-like Fe-S oxidoreductase